MKLPKIKIIPLNFILIFLVTVGWNIATYTYMEVGFVYLSTYTLVLNIAVLILLAIGSFLMKNNNAGKSYLLSIPYSIATFILITIIFFFMSYHF